MSKKIPFLELFAALCRDAELAAAVEGWLVVSAAIDRTSRTAEVRVEGAAGACVGEAGTGKVEGEAAELANDSDVRKAYLGC